MNNNQSQEDYLETILILSEKLPVVRSIDIANDMGYKKSSISIAMKHLREKKLITVTDAGYINLTEEGSIKAHAVYERHKVLSECLMELGVPKELALADACRVEHDLSPESFAAIKAHHEKRKKQ